MVDQVPSFSWFGLFQRWEVGGVVLDLRCSQKNSWWRKERDETNNPRRRPSSSSLYSFLDILSCVYYISITQRYFSLIFGYPKGLSNIYVLQNFHEETHFIERDMIESLFRSNTWSRIIQTWQDKRRPTLGHFLLIFMHGLLEKGAQCVP